MFAYNGETKIQITLVFAMVCDRVVFYLRDCLLTDKLISCNAGCYINDICLNHVMYAANIMSISPYCKCNAFVV